MGKELLKLLRHRLQLVELVLRHFARLQQLLHLCFRVALKVCAELLELLHHLPKLPHRVWHGGHTAAQRVKKRVRHFGYTILYFWLILWYNIIEIKLI